MLRRALLPVLLVAAAACSGAEPKGNSSPVVLIGVDGLEPTIVDELLAAGRMPNFARFVEVGTLGRLTSMVPSYSPVIWTTIATGQAPDAHGIDFFHDATGLPFSSNSRRVPALWNLVSDAGRSVNCVGWWITWPAETINGRMLSSYAAQAQASLIWKPGVWETLEDQTWPPNLFEEIRPAMTFVGEYAAVRDQLFEVFPRPSSLRDVTKKSVTDLGWTYAADLTASAVTSLLMERYPADLTMAYMAMPDVAGHRFWSFREPQDFNFEVPTSEITDFGRYIDLSYVEIDRLLGEMLAQLPDDANVIVVSDHGMHTFADAVDDPETGNTGHHQDECPGIFAAMGPAFAARGNLLRERNDLGSVLEIAPLVLRLLGVPAPEHWPAVKARSSMTFTLDGKWARENELVAGPNPDSSFRPATPPRVPATDMDAEFLGKLRDLGYLVGDEAEEAE